MTRCWPLLLIIVLPLILVLAITLGARGEQLPQGLSCDDVRRIVQSLSEEEKAYYAQQLTAEQLKAVKQCLARR